MEVRKIEDLKKERDNMSRQEYHKQRCLEFSKLVAAGNKAYNKLVKDSNGPVENYVLKYKKTVTQPTSEELLPCAFCGNVYRSKSYHRHQCTNTNDNMRNIPPTLKAVKKVVSKEELIKASNPEYSNELSTMLASLR